MPARSCPGIDWSLGEGRATSVYISIDVYVSVAGGCEWSGLCYRSTYYSGDGNRRGVAARNGEYLVVCFVSVIPGCAPLVFVYGNGLVGG